MLKKILKKIDLRINILQGIKGQLTNEIVEDLISNNEYREELVEKLNSIEYLKRLLVDVEYSGNKILYNND